VGASLAVGGDLEGTEALALVLASTSPQRRAILEQLGVPFVVVAPDYEEGGGRPVLGVDTDVFVEGRRFGKAASADEAEAILAELAGRTHEVVSGLCLRAPGFKELHRVVTEVTFRPLGAAEVQRYVSAGEWEGRAGSYAIQGVGASLVERVDGDYLNVVGLPAALLVRLLAQRFPGRYGFG